MTVPEAMADVINGNLDHHNTKPLGYTTTPNGKMAVSKSDRIHSSSTSPGSASGRSSTSSLHTVGTNQMNGSNSSQQRKKVSINEHPVTFASSNRSPRELSAKLAASTNNLTNASVPANSLANSNHRTSLLHISAEKRARKVRFFINNDKFFKGATIAVSCEKFRTFDKLLEHLTRIMCNQVTLPNGVRFIFALDGKAVQQVEGLLHEENYVCSSLAQFKKIDYLKIAQQDDHQWNRIKREDYYLGNGKSTHNALKRDAYKQSGHSKSFGLTKSAHHESSSTVSEVRFQMKPKIIAVLRGGMKPRRAFRVLLNHRNTKSFETILGDLTALVKLDSGAVRKVFALDGKPVIGVADFVEPEVFIVYGSDKCQNEDFELDIVEFRNIQSIIKSPNLDAQYEKFASASSQNASPKTSRKKFLSSRHPVNRSAGKSRKSSKSRDSPRSNGDSSQYTLGHASSAQQYPNEVASKYLVGDIIGDGNFAVVRKCMSKKTKVEYALKIIEKSKCQGKEHMIESEIEILNAVSHSYIIQLIEVFDTPEEKYLVTEYVKGGDLFDAIAMDTKYSEEVSRGMVRDLTSALKYLHDKMIVHRDIKPENLLVVDLPQQGMKSLKLGDFGLAQVVTEPLFTVCGTPTYVAPEILAETGYGVKVDVWATGVIMYILLVGFPPFSSRTNNQEELFDQILSGLFEFNSPDWDDISYRAKELISWMLQVDPLQRYSAFEILEHPWTKGAQKEE
ncbi:serine/threonine-protein kinase DCLK1-like [Tigriopus californicus]|uniref:serine/threonine-protein kinase DCLK1-like n=1 Tax=Tigriopus californicus TaxID=6832 RepID=UPI0027DA7F96|nr:serine/threonine-protein kinase DCLK1-like [Tigriopus californicus]XP_059080812.1 serine/threonine-protein kinase DCLK1-like [Tigriopus californicus]XP_059080813.1 serine/threonine-protein kinase DCLK1-like [Tigriopus californicus]XP_059080814.1 serine/threonine-protein kinase DCLK1-like [Tigriopus californicus]